MCSYAIWILPIENESRIKWDCGWEYFPPSNELNFLIFQLSFQQLFQCLLIITPRNNFSIETFHRNISLPERAALFKPKVRWVMLFTWWWGWLMWRQSKKSSPQIKGSFPTIIILQSNISCSINYNDYVNNIIFLRHCDIYRQQPHTVGDETTKRCLSSARDLFQQSRSHGYFKFRYYNFNFNYERAKHISSCLQQTQRVSCLYTYEWIESQKIIGLRKALCAREKHKKVFWK